MVPKLEVWLILLVVLVFASLDDFALAKPQVPCYFIFGDSGVDNGNNMGLQTLAKPNYPPYGIDLPAGVPTGRFTNGRTATDYIAELLGFKTFPPPYITASGREILTGVNYASGGAGLLDESGTNLGQRITAAQQLRNHVLITSRIAQILGSEAKAASLLSKCIYSLTLGSNDYVNNYLMPVYPSKSRYGPDKWASIVVQKYGQHLRALYNYGARKIVVFSLERLGCAPVIIAAYGGSGSGDDISCIESINQVAEIYNRKLISLINGLNREFTQAKFIYVDVFTLKPTDLGLKLVETPCCKLPNKYLGLCISGSAPCEDRDTHVFWDGYHTSQIVNKGIANNSYYTIPPHGVHPMNIAQLAQLEI